MLKYECVLRIYIPLLRNQSEPTAMVGGKKLSVDPLNAGGGRVAQLNKQAPASNQISSSRTPVQEVLKTVTSDSNVQVEQRWLSVRTHSLCFHTHPVQSPATQSKPPEPMPIQKDYPSNEIHFNKDDKNHPFSNYAEFPVVYQNTEYKTAEHCFQALKVSGTHILIVLQSLISLPVSR